MKPLATLVMGLTLAGNESATAVNELTAVNPINNNTTELILDAFSQGDESDSIHWQDVEIINTDRNVDSKQQKPRDKIAAKTAASYEIYRDIYTPLTKEEENNLKEGIRQTVTVENIEFDVYVNNDTVIIKSPMFNEIWEKYRDHSYSDLAVTYFKRGNGLITKEEEYDKQYKFAENYLNETIEKLKEEILRDFKEGIIPNDNYQYFHDKIEETFRIYFEGIFDTMCLLLKMSLFMGRPILLIMVGNLASAVKERNELKEMTDSDGYLLGQMVSALSNQNQVYSISNIMEDIDKLTFPKYGERSELNDRFNDVECLICDLRQIFKNIQRSPQKIAKNSLNLTKRYIKFEHILNKVSDDIKSYKEKIEILEKEINILGGTISNEDIVDLEKSIENFKEKIKPSKPDNKKENYTTYDISEIKENVEDLDLSKKLYDETVNKLQSTRKEEKYIQLLRDYLIKIKNLIEPIFNKSEESKGEINNTGNEDEAGSSNNTNQTS